MQEIMIEIMNSFGYLGVALLIMIENLFPPIPSEVILTFGGFMTTYTDLKPLGVVAAATIGSAVGAIMLYFVGSLLNKELLDKLLSGKAGKILHFRASDVEKAVKSFDERGKGTVFVCRCVPIVRSLISIPAGMAHMDFKIFLCYTVMGSTIWNFVLIYAGAAAGASWDKISIYMDKYSDIVKCALYIVIFLAGVKIGRKDQERSEV